MNKQTGQSLPAENLQEILDSAKNAADLGAQQFVTPPALAMAASLPLPRYRGMAADFQCGHGALLAGIHAERVLGCDIQPEAVRAATAAFSSIQNPESSIQHHSFHCADITALYPLLAEADCEFDLLALNPPFSLQWHTERLRDLLDSDCAAVRQAFGEVQGKETIDSTFATFLIALDRLSERGEGYMICSQQSAVKMFGLPEQRSEIGDQKSDLFPLREHVWAWLRVPQCTLFANATIDMAIIYFARSHDSTYKPVLYFPMDEGSGDTAIAATLRILASQRLTMRRGLTVSSQYEANGDTPYRWDLAVRELKARCSGKPPKHNLWLEKDGRIGVYLTPFQHVSTKLPKEDVKALWKLKDQFPSSLVVQKFTRCALLRAVHGGIWTVEPSLIAVVVDAVKEYDAIRAPFFPLNAVQRLGYLDEEDSILCKKDFHTNLQGDEKPQRQIVVPEGGVKTWTGYDADDFNTRTKQYEKTYQFDDRQSAETWRDEWKSTTAPAFKAGERYDMGTATRTLCNFEQRMTLDGTFDKVQISGCEMVITITGRDDRGNAVRHEFVPDPAALIIPEGTSRFAKKQAPQPISNGHDLAALVEHFDIPHVRDIAEIYPDRFQTALAALAEIEIAINSR